MKYLDTAIAMELHEIVLKYSNGLSGIRNASLVSSPLEAIKDDGYYPNFSDKLAFLLYSFVNNHPFADGNKRTAIMLCALFLSVNGYSERQVNLFVYWAELVALNIATGKMNLEETKDSFSVWLDIAKGVEK